MINTWSSALLAFSMAINISRSRPLATGRFLGFLSELVVGGRKDMNEVRGGGGGKKLSIPGRGLAIWRREETFESEDGHLRDERWNTKDHRKNKYDLPGGSIEQEPMTFNTCRYGEGRGDRRVICGLEIELA